MTKGKLIVLEGIDGSGKATQSALLEKKLKDEGKEVMHISFPDYDSESSALVKMYLSGQFGKDPGDVNPYAASLFYAVDRFASYRTKWKDFYEKGGVVIADRYTTSNMVHQMTKYDDKEEREKFLSWLEKTEYEELELPRPDLVILLDIPLAISENLVRERAKQGGSMDIHEQHLDYLKKCYDAYQELVSLYGWQKIACAENGSLRRMEDIAEEVETQVNHIISDSRGEKVSMGSMRTEVDIDDLNFPHIWADGNESYWFSKAWEILKNQGLTSFSVEDKAGEQKVKLLAVSLGAMYLDFCKVAFGEGDYYDSLYEDVTCSYFPENEITYLCGAMEIDYPFSIKETLFQLEQEQRRNILSALEVELSLTEICLGMYFTSMHQGTINNWLGIDAEDDSNDYENYEWYWDAIKHQTDQLTFFADFGDLMTAFQWMQEGAYQIGHI